MSEKQKTYMAVIVLIGSFVIPELDAAYITPKMKESDLQTKIRCHDEPNNCWIQKRAR